MAFTDNFFGVKTRAQLIDESETTFHEKPVEVPIPQQETKVEVSLDNIMYKLLKGVRENSLGKYRAGYLKMEDQFKTSADEKMETIQATANSVLSLFQKKEPDPYGDDISTFDKEAWEQYRTNFKALAPEEKLALNTLLTPEVKQQMSRGETILLQELLDNYTVKAEMAAMNPFAFK